MGVTAGMPRLLLYLELLNCRVYFTSILNINPITHKSDRDFPLSNARHVYLSKGDPLGVKRLENYLT